MMERTEAVSTRYDDEPSIPYNYYPPDATTPTLCEVQAIAMWTRFLVGG